MKTDDFQCPLQWQLLKRANSFPQQVVDAVLLQSSSGEESESDSSSDALSEGWSWLRQCWQRGHSFAIILVEVFLKSEVASPRADRQKIEKGYGYYIDLRSHALVLNRSTWRRSEIWWDLIRSDVTKVPGGSSSSSSSSTDSDDAAVTDLAAQSMPKEQEVEQHQADVKMQLLGF
jgi:hypothetical protein